MKYFTICCIAIAFSLFSYLRIQEGQHKITKEEKLILLRNKMQHHNDKMKEWVDQAKKETDPDYHQWMIEQAMQEAFKYSECKGVLRYIGNGNMP